MNCKFCNRPCIPAFWEPVQVIDPDPQRHRAKHESCKNHQYIVTYAIYDIYDDSVVKYWFNLAFKNKTWGFKYMSSVCYPLESFSLFNGSETLLAWNFIPSITPDNALEKLPTLLTFL